ncbi:MAG: 4-hydroxythreonine-4-phosphate dehydrogenase [Cyanobacteriota bacterium]|nr:4-hydroxythreonine-4-phosphate dehydrogenase [Cyanobacteriota bacterium]
MLRWLIVGLLLLGLGIGLQRGWLMVRWDRMAEDTNLPFLNDPGQPLRWLGQP